MTSLLERLAVILGENEEGPEDEEEYNDEKEDGYTDEVKK